MISESQMETAAQECVEGGEKAEEPGGWNDLVGDLEDNKGFQNFNDKKVFVPGVM